MRIRSATNADTEQIRALVFSILRQYDLEPDPRGIDADLDDIAGNYLEPGGVFDVVLLCDKQAVENENDRQNANANANDRIVGTVGLYPRADEVCELRKMYLETEVRGRGWGRLLLERMIQRAGQLGFRRIELETAAVLVEACRLYERYGFERIEPRLTCTRCEIVMALEL